VNILKRSYIYFFLDLSSAALGSGFAACSAGFAVGAFAPF
jgi:hypothetical protein